VDQSVAAFRGRDQVRVIPGVGRDHDRFIGCFKAVTVGVLHSPCSTANATMRMPPFAVDLTGLGVVHLDPESACRYGLHAVQPDVQIFLTAGQDVGRHRAQRGRSEGLEWPVA